MASKRRRSAVDEVLGSASPVAGKIKAQQEAARRAREKDQIDERPPSGERARSNGVSAEEPRHAPSRAQPRKTREVEVRPVKRGGGAPTPTKRTDRTAPAPVAAGKRRPAKRIPITGNEGEVWEDVCTALSRQVGAKVSFAAASRAIWSMVAELEESFGHVEAPQLTRPANADWVGNADFEEQLKGYIRAVILKSGRR